MRQYVYVGLMFNEKLQKIDVIVLSEIQCNINYLRNLEHVIVLNVFASLLYAWRVYKNTLCSPLSHSSRQLVDYAIKVFYAITESNLVDLFHHLDATIPHLYSLQL
jgi:hypothetical protein